MHWTWERLSKMKMSNALMSDGVLELAHHCMVTYLAGKCFHVKMLEEDGIYRLASDSLCFQLLGKGSGIIPGWITDPRFWLLGAKET